MGKMVHTSLQICEYLSVKSADKLVNCPIEDSGEDSKESPLA